MSQSVKPRQLGHHLIKLSSRFVSRLLAGAPSTLKKIWAIFRLSETHTINNLILYGIEDLQPFIKVSKS